MMAVPCALQDGIASQMKVWGLRKRHVMQQIAQHTDVRLARIVIDAEHARS